MGHRKLGFTWPNLHFDILNISLIIFRDFKNAQLSVNSHAFVQIFPNYFLITRAIMLVLNFFLDSVFPKFSL